MPSQIREAIAHYERCCAEVEELVPTADDITFGLTVDSALDAMFAVTRMPVTCSDDAVLLMHFMLGETFVGMPVFMVAQEVARLC